MLLGIPKSTYEMAVLKKFNILDFNTLFFFRLVTCLKPGSRYRNYIEMTKGK